MPLSFPQIVLFRVPPPDQITTRRRTPHAARRAIGKRDARARASPSPPDARRAAPTTPVASLASYLTAVRAPRPDGPVSAITQRCTVPIGQGSRIWSLALGWRGHEEERHARPSSPEMLQLLMALAFSAAPLTLYVPPVRSLSLFVEAMEAVCRDCAPYSQGAVMRFRLGLSRILAGLARALR